MSKINKILSSLIIVLILLMGISVNASTIIETTNPDDTFDTIADGTFVIGITKFNPDVIVTAGRVATATFNDVLFNHNQVGYSGVNIYYYTSGFWFKFDEQNNAEEISPDDPMYDQINSPDIYYVNNQEKILFAPYIRDVADGVSLVFETDNNKDVVYQDGILRVPATVRRINIYEQEGNEDPVLVGNLSKNNESDDVFNATTLVNLSSSIEQKSHDFVQHYYNQYNSETLTNVVDDLYYVNLGNYRSSSPASSLTIGDANYNVSGTEYVGESLKISIGNNAFINAPVWKIVDGNVYVALTWLVADAMPEQDTLVTVGDQTFAVNMFAPNSNQNYLLVSNVAELFNPAGYTATASYNNNVVDYTFTHGTQAVGVTLSYGLGNVLDVDEIVLLKDENKNMAVTNPEFGHTYVYYFKYKDSPVIHDEEYEKIYKVAVPGKGIGYIEMNGHARVKSIDLSTEIANKADAMIETYYNKYNSVTLTEVDDDVYYINLGLYRGSANPDSLSIADATYEVSETANIGKLRKISIGNNAFINAPVWKIVDGNVFVAVTWLAADAMPNQATEINIGGQTFKVNAYATDTSSNTLNITNAGGLFGPAGYETHTEYDGNEIEFYYTHGTQALGVELSYAGYPITAANQIVFCKSSNGHMAITTTEYGYTFVLYFGYYEAPVTEPAEHEVNYKVAIPGSGVANLHIYGHEVTTIDIDNNA